MRWRLFITVWIVFALHATTNVVRETYLAITLAEHGSVRVDDYLGLHPDLFEIPGRGSYINNNPGASVAGALPWLAFRPVAAVLFRLRPDLIAPKPAAAYDDPRPNRTRFMNESRSRGLDVKLGLAALVTQAGLMAPLGALATLVIFAWFQSRAMSRRAALGLALLFAFGTPTFFRAAFLNQNALLAHYTLFAFVLMSGFRFGGGADADAADESIEREPSNAAVMGAGALLGFGLLTDYSAAPLLLVFGVWAMVIGGRRGGGMGGALRGGLRFTAGASAFIALLFAYQWLAFGSPWYPAQRYMPPTQYSAEGWFGFTPPSSSLLVGNLLDPRYGLFAFSPLLLAAFAEPFMRSAPRLDRTLRVVIWSAFGALWLFSSSIQFATLQWNTGVRYMVPAAPLLFLLAAPALLRLSAPLRWGLIVSTLTISWSVSMTREAVPRALLQVFTGGFELPMLTVLKRMASGYAPWLEGEVSPLPLLVLTSVILWLIWRGFRTDEPSSAA